MRTRFYYPAVIQDNDLIKFEQCKYAGRNNNSGLILQIGIEVTDDLFFSTGVYGRQAIIEHQDVRVHDEGPGNGDTLLLAAAQRYAPLPYHGVETFAETEDVFFYRSLTCSLLYRFEVCGGHAETYIISNII